MLRSWLTDAIVLLDFRQGGWWGSGCVVFNDVRNRVGDIMGSSQLLCPYASERFIGVAVSAGYILAVRLTAGCERFFPDRVAPGAEELYRRET